MEEYVFAIDENTCIECGSCRRYCPVPNTIFIDADYQHTIDPSMCTGCGICEAFCPVPNTIFQVSHAEAQSRERLKAIRRSIWRSKWHYETHPVMGPVTLEARRMVRDFDHWSHADQSVVIG